MLAGQGNDALGRGNLLVKPGAISRIREIRSVFGDREGERRDKWEAGCQCRRRHNLIRTIGERRPDLN